MYEYVKWRLKIHGRFLREGDEETYLLETGFWRYNGIDVLFYRDTSVCASCSRISRYCRLGVYGLPTKLCNVINMIQPLAGSRGFVTGLVCLSSRPYPQGRVRGSVNFHIR